MTKKYAFRGMELISDAANEDAIPDSNDEVDRLELEGGYAWCAVFTFMYQEKSPMLANGFMNSV